MAVQIGTVDGLVYISEKNNRCFVNAIKFFDENCRDRAKSEDIPFGAAFQRLVEPVYADPSLSFSVSSIKNPVYTKGGNEQSPARVTFCKKMGLLAIDEPNGIFKLTALGEAFHDGKITIEEYAFILLSKLGVFKDKRYCTNVLAYIAEVLHNEPVISDELLKDRICKKYNDSSIAKTRADVIIGAMELCGLISNVAKQTWVIKNTQSAAILADIFENRSLFSEAKHDEDAQYCDYIGSMNNGIFDIINPDNAGIYLELFPGLGQYVDAGKTSGSAPAVPMVPKKRLASYNAALAENHRNYLTAIMTKPFLLLAGISGTGKSQIVRKLAQATDDIDIFKNEEDRWECHKPANFELVQVKPNWHNSYDLVGYKSNINGEHYEYTPFIEFVAKAWKNPNTPFFLCLDEMNLAPVEEYFAEYLSAIESRSIDNTAKNFVLRYQTDPVIKPFDSFGKDVSADMLDHLFGNVLDPVMEKHFREKGLTLPPNLIVMGTVNMDDTTFSFSRKVLDRAMSIEMNEVDFSSCIMPKEEQSIPVLTDLNYDLVCRPIKSLEVIEGTGKEDTSISKLLTEDEADMISSYLTSLNDEVLENTPFKLGYRACNEALLYACASKNLSGDDYLASAIDDFTTMKILSRIEGDEQKLKTKLGEPLLEKIEEKIRPMVQGLAKSVSLEKIDSMKRILERDKFVSFWG